MSEEILIRQGAPTLAGIKTGSLFPCPCEDREDLLADIRRLNRLLVPKGLCLLPIRFLEGQALLYLYRPAELRRDLQDVLASELLRQAGYADESCARCVAQLIRRFRESGEFPHEVGLFLSYPPEDVKGFIDHRANDFKCAGLWKVYGDEAKAQALFAKFKKCTEISGRPARSSSSLPSQFDTISSSKGTYEYENCCCLLERYGQYGGHGEGCGRGHDRRRRGGCAAHARQGTAR